MMGLSRTCWNSPGPLLPSRSHPRNQARLQIRPMEPPPTPVY